MVTGATIHTENGLSMTATRRQPSSITPHTTTAAATTATTATTTVNGMHAHTAHSHINGHVNSASTSSSSEGKCPF
jgi:hypothetical protein